MNILHNIAHKNFIEQTYVKKISRVRDIYTIVYSEKSTLSEQMLKYCIH